MSVSLSINGKKADALPDADFGFREFWVENGEFPDDERMLSRIIKGISYNNAVRYFGFDLEEK